MASVAEKEWVSIDDYLAGELVAEVKHEYLGGMVHAMSGATIRHNRVSGNIFMALGNQLRGQSCRPFNSDTKVRLDLPLQTRFYYPDLQVVCDSREDEDSYQDKPVVVVEVLSDSTRRVDLGEKRDAYLTIPSLRVLLIVDPARLWVQVDRRGSSGGFTQELYRAEGDLIPFPEIKCELPISEVYEGVRLE